LSDDSDDADDDCLTTTTTTAHASSAAAMASLSMLAGPFGAMQSLLGMTSRAPASSMGGPTAANITSNPAVQQFIERGMSFLPSWMQVDMSMLVAIVFMAGYMWQPLLMLGDHLYWAIVRFFTASISITQSDRLNMDVIQYIASEIVPNGGTRVLTARSEYVGARNRFFSRATSKATKTGDPITDERVKPIEYLPGFQMIVFRFGWNIMMVSRVADRPSFPGEIGSSYANAPSGDEAVVVKCLGRSIEPIKRFLDHCRSFSAHRRDQWVAVRIPRTDHDYYGEGAWDEPVMRPARPLETVHFDDAAKKGLINDIRKYLDPATKSFYLSRGIPYRRGYLLHGPPGTGKSSLSLSLASLCQLDLYLVHLPSLGYQGDRLLARLFHSLPARCIVLIEDIDAVGLRRDLKTLESSKRSKKKMMPNAPRMPSSDGNSMPTCTLSGLLNVLDGVASQEGRIVLMTSNHPEKLDPALIRPGRIDRRVFLGHIDQESASSMFMRMFSRAAQEEEDSKTKNKPKADKEADDSEKATGMPAALLAWDGDSSPVKHELRELRLASLAAKFAAQIPAETFTPAQLQGFLLRHRGEPDEAVAKLAEWIPEEKAAATRP
jgi:chaperone BCS1